MAARRFIQYACWIIFLVFQQTIGWENEFSAWLLLFNLCQLLSIILKNVVVLEKQIMNLKMNKAMK
jgi:hypothetical protein